MNISRNWLSQYVELNCDLATLCDRLTMAGIEVEAIENSCSVPKGVVVGKILERAPHANSDHLSVCKVFDGKEELQIVCGAPNCDAGKTVPLATLGTVFKTAEGEFAIKKSKIRGVESFGMLCSGKELGISDDDSGLLILDDALKAGTPLEEIFPGDSMLELEVTPNRPDWLSHWGVARDVSCLLGTEAKLPALEPLKLDPAPAGLVTVEDNVTCPRYIGRVIRGVTVGESPDWLKERLISVGLRPINNVVDVTNFILMELGQPLHAFDLDLLAGKRVVVRRARRGESIVTLDGKKVELSEKNLVIADTGKPMALAGVMGGESSGVTAKTVDILLESAIFDAANIRATSRELGITSDSSYRYERGVDYEMADYASDRAAALIAALTGAKSVSAKVDVTPGKPACKVIHCRFDRIRSLVGVEIDNAAIIDIFRKLRLEVAKVTEESCEVTAPLFRLDLEREADLGEEVARINGLDKVPVRPVTGKAVSSISEDAYVKIQQMRDELIGFGLFECMHYSMVSEKSALADTRFAASDLVVIDNPLSLELAVMRPSL
ncbi:MAG: phenylalanine--tRNA ligase subunit beta, partial [Victivallaceae bacterium]